MRESCATVLMLLLLACPRVAAAENGYGLAVGLGAPLGSTDALGVAVGLSAFRTDFGGPRSMMRAHGELLGIVTRDTKAVMPTLVGELGGQVGDVDIFITAGVQMFGFAWRQGYTVFGMVGLCGGVGMAMRLNSRLRVGFRGAVTWLPSDTTAIIVEDDGDKPTFAFISVMLTVEYTPFVAARKPSELMAPPEL